MFNYYIQKWVIARRFEKTDRGFLYRRRPDLPGIMLTDDERRETIRVFRRRYWRFWLRIFAIMMATFFALAIAAVIFRLDETFLILALFVLASVMIAFVLKEQREWSLIPEEQFADRPRIASDLPTGGWLVRNQNLARRRSWPVNIGLIGLYGFALWFLAPRSLEAGLVQWFFFACFAFGFLALIHGVIGKARQPR
ncbi:hypothetical protein [Aurantiacibacter suaedae]|uniref:hypothetical protein n=1 Tax=Aurantiacibacter suaedae TaxID=2545755 RepID=UPI0010F63D06|nr:hypothetical protein [Aurantiacibacter suaedae]